VTVQPSSFCGGPVRAKAELRRGISITGKLQWPRSIRREASGAYVLNVQVKTEIAARGQSKEEADFRRSSGIIRERSTRGYVVLEYNAPRIPRPRFPGTVKTIRSLISVKRNTEPA